MGPHLLPIMPTYPNLTSHIQKVPLPFYFFILPISPWMTTISSSHLPSSLASSRCHLAAGQPPQPDPSLPSPYSPLPPSLLTTTPFPGCCRQTAAAGRPPTPSHPPCSSPLTSQQLQPQPLPLSPRATVRGSCSLPSFFCFIILFISFIAFHFHMFLVLLF